ncbi:MAG: hypothetical protein M1825_005273 [Sarcosagium campestre]|nr:MAG: hypothetical protein M1825_005273 [Sarcosagium campestre]
MIPAAQPISVPPLLSTPDDHIFDYQTSRAVRGHRRSLTGASLRSVYEVQRTVEEIERGAWKRIALQFPDELLVDAPAVVEALQRDLRYSPSRRGAHDAAGKATSDEFAKAHTSNGCQDTPQRSPSNCLAGSSDHAETGDSKADIADSGPKGSLQQAHQGHEHYADQTSVPAHTQTQSQEEKIFILGDTSYGSCCVDEIAAEHVDADVVVHYGRACLSPTARLPVIYVFTQQELQHERVMSAFRDAFPDKNAKVILMADVTYASHVPSLKSSLAASGYAGVFETLIVHDPSSLLPNRTTPVPSEPKESLNDALSSKLGDTSIADINQDKPDENPGATTAALVTDPIEGSPRSSKLTPINGLISSDADAYDDKARQAELLKDYHVFHISEPAPSLLLTLASRLATVTVFPTTAAGCDDQDDGAAQVAYQASSSAALRRRYALLTSMSTVAIWGILINTLSVKNYMHMVEHVKRLIATAGKKSYTFVVGKLNAAKIANFAEVGGWVVIGCWESSLVDSKDFYKPVITPFELELALQSDRHRVWTGEWTSDLNAVLKQHDNNGRQDRRQPTASVEHDTATSSTVEQDASKADHSTDIDDDDDNADLDSEPESAPPEFDLRTGRYVSDTRPLRAVAAAPSSTKPGAGTDNETHSSSQTVARRHRTTEVATIGGTVSPGAEFLRSNRTWTGLGSDLNVAYENDDDDNNNNNNNNNNNTDDRRRPGAAATIEQGRAGTARAYKHPFSGSQQR